MERAYTKIKTSAKKYPEEEVLWNKGVQKTVVKIHERYLWDSLLLKLKVIQCFFHKFFWRSLPHFLLATVMNTYCLEQLLLHNYSDCDFLKWNKFSKFYVLTQFFINESLALLRWAGSAKWISKWRGHGVLKSIERLEFKNSWPPQSPDKKNFWILDGLEWLKQKHFDINDNILIVSAVACPSSPPPFPLVSTRPWWISIKLSISRFSTYSC